MHTFSKDEMAGRLFRVRKELNNNAQDALYLTGASNIRYLTGFQGEPHQAIVTADRAVLFTNPRSASLAESQVPIFEVVPTKKAMEDISVLLQQEKVTKLGVEATTTWQTFNALKERFSFVKIEVSHAVERVRFIKSPAEITLLKQAQRYAEEIFTQIKSEIGIGMTEKQLHCRILQLIAENNILDGFSFLPITPSAYNCWPIHPKPTDKPFEKGDSIIIDMGVKYQGYCSDMTRTVFIGEPSGKQREVYETVLQAQKEAFTAICSGQQNHLVDKAARDYITSKGYGEFFNHGLGHSIGLDVHEPLLGFGKVRQENTLKPGMVMTVEPGIYLENQFGVRIEDTIVVTESGHKNLMNTASDLQANIIY